VGFQFVGGLLGPLVGYLIASFFFFFVYSYSHLAYLDYGGALFFRFLSAVPPRKSGSVAATSPLPGKYDKVNRAHQEEDKGDVE